jgi:3-mercaptopyruvate sulfurtransferase SseA
MTLSPVAEHPAATAEQAYAHFAAKLSFETDPADVARAIEDGDVDFLLIDTRKHGHYTKSHLPGAINVPVKELIGGYQYWVREGWPTEGKRPLEARVTAPAITDLGLFV